MRKSISTPYKFTPLTKVWESVIIEKPVNFQATNPSDKVGWLQ